MIRDPLPQKVSALEKYNITKVICGSDQTFCLTSSTNSPDGTHCFSWGSNQNAKLGHSYFKPSSTEFHSSSSIQIVKTPSLLKSLEGQKIDNLSCGTNHSFAWSTDTGLVYGWGLGLNGRLGNESDAVV
jgi:alpha-tubulin suppressor-like RCC1 family protein